MKRWFWAIALIAGFLEGCGNSDSQQEVSMDGSNEVLLRVGAIEVTQSDLDHALRRTRSREGAVVPEADREKALETLAQRARLVQAALDAGLLGDPLLRDEMARLLSNHYREKELHPRMGEALNDITEPRLRALFEERKDQFELEERRQVAVLWLDPRDDPAKVKKYQERLAEARERFTETSETTGAELEEGFSVWSIDHSEHAASRFQGGVVGWFGRSEGSSAWQRVLVEAVFQIEHLGELSPVISGPEGVFLVRWIGIRPGSTRTFESVREALEREERARVRRKVEEAFQAELEARYPSKK